MKKRSEKGRALFYTRDSGGKHETTPSEYVRWAQGRAKELGVQFSGTPDAIEAMIRSGQSVDDDLFLDFGVPGNILSREGLDSLLKTVLNDASISHVFIPRRNRLARPDHPIDGVKLEDALRRQGVTIVFMDKTLPPLKRGRRPDIAELIVAAVDYDRSSEDRRELADGDYRTDVEKPKVIRNPEEVRIIAPARFDAPVDSDRHRQLLAQLNERAGTQRGKPRSRDPKKNPLGSRAFDMSCGWPLYRQPYGERFRYLCGLYQQSHGAECSHNHVDGLTATRFVLSCVRQHALSP